MKLDRGFAVAFIKSCRTGLFLGVGGDGDGLSQGSCSLDCHKKIFHDTNFTLKTLYKHLLKAKETELVTSAFLCF